MCDSARDFRTLELVKWNSNTFRPNGFVYLTRQPLRISRPSRYATAASFFIASDQNMNPVCEFCFEVVMWCCLTGASFGQFESYFLIELAEDASAKKNSKVTQDKLTIWDSKVWLGLHAHFCISLKIVKNFKVRKEIATDWRSFDGL